MNLDLETARLMLGHLIKSVVPLAASGEDLVAYAHSHGDDLDETAADFVDWTIDSVPSIIANGLLPDEVESPLRVLFDQTIAALASAPTEGCATAVLYPEWSLVRASATTVLRQFRDLGLPIPSLQELSGAFQ